MISQYALISAKMLSARLLNVKFQRDDVRV